MAFDLLVALKNKKLFLVGVATILLLSLVVGEKMREKENIHIRTGCSAKERAGESDDAVFRVPDRGSVNPSPLGDG